MGVSAKVICDSSFGNTRLITLEVELHRFILPEFNTHRSLSRNFQSSRAVPIEKMIEQVRSDPAIPVRFGKNKSGMQDDGEHNNTVGIKSPTQVYPQYYRNKEAWKRAAESACYFAEGFNEAGYHKQLVNRLLEPFMWTKGVVTGTYDAWQAFLKLRAHKDAQPEIQALAFKIRDAIEDSVSVELGEGEWHLPYVKEQDFPEAKLVAGKSSRLEAMIKVSTSCAAQVSYRKLDDSLDKAIKIYDMLNLPKDGVYPVDPPHFSPTEHVAMATMRFADKHLSGNFNTLDFIQYRKLLENGIESRYLK